MSKRRHRARCNCARCSLRRGWDRTLYWPRHYWSQMIAWRRRTLGDGFIGRALLPDDVTAVAFRAACVVAAAIIVVREIAGMNP